MGLADDLNESIGVNVATDGGVDLVGVEMVEVIKPAFQRVGGQAVALHFHQTVSPLVVPLELEDPGVLEELAGPLEFVGPGRLSDEGGDQVAGGSNRFSETKGIGGEADSEQPGFQIGRVGDSPPTE